MIPGKEFVIGIILMGIFYIVGCQFYIFRIPERFKPGFFDIWFCSHNIWHGFVVAAALVHYYNLVKVYTLRSGLQCLS